MQYSHHYTPEVWLLVHIFDDYAAQVTNVLIKPLSEITITDLPFVREMPTPRDGVIIFNMKSGDMRTGRLEFTPEMKSNIVRFAKENAKEYLEKRKNPKSSPDSV